MRETIEAFIYNPSEDKLQLDVEYIQYYKNILEDFGYEMQDISSTNGWSVDFFYYFRHKYNNSVLLLSGSLWYGDYSLIKI